MNATESDTPETDAHILNKTSFSLNAPIAQKMQKLERERDAFREALRELTESSTQSERDHQPSRAVMLDGPCEPAWKAWENARHILSENVPINQPSAI